MASDLRNALLSYNACDARDALKSARKPAQKRDQKREQAENFKRQRKGALAMMRQCPRPGPVAEKQTLTEDGIAPSGAYTFGPPHDILHPLVTFMGANCPAPSCDCNPPRCDCHAPSCDCDAPM